MGCYFCGGKGKIGSKYCCEDLEEFTREQKRSPNNFIEAFNWLQCRMEKIIDFRAEKFGEELRSSRT